MAYASISDLIARYQPIKTMIGTSSYDVTSSEVASVYIWQAESFIDAKIANRYQVPLTAPPSPLITQIAADLGIFYMLAERLPTIPEFMDKRYQRCMDMLDAISSGSLIVLSATVVTSGDSFAWSPNMDYHPVFSPVLSPVNQKVDEDRVAAESQERWTDVSS